MLTGLFTILPSLDIVSIYFEGSEALLLEDKHAPALAELVEMLHEFVLEVAFLLRWDGQLADALRRSVLAYLRQVEADSWPVTAASRQRHSTRRTTKVEHGDTANLFGRLHGFLA